MSEITDTEAESIFGWQEKRKRPDGVHVQPLTGFGPRGEYVLWVAPPAKAGRYVFHDGKPVWEEAESALATDPELERLRDQILQSVVHRGPGRLLVGLCFLTYASRLLSNSYRFEDADLQMLLFGGSGWHDGVLQHVLGGEGVVRELAKLSPEIMATPSLSPVGEGAAADIGRGRPALLERIRAAFKRR